MAFCRICLRDYTNPRFLGERVAICGHCVRDLNEKPEVAQGAESRLSALLRQGIMKKANRNLSSPEAWQRQEALYTLENFDEVYQRALPGWLNRLLENSENTSADFKRVRAYRRGLLHYDRPRGWGYPANWNEVATRIRRLDSYTCQRCNASDVRLDVHHIVYLSHFGTHQQTNLITLCQACHEDEHGRCLDYGESSDLSGAAG